MSRFTGLSWLDYLVLVVCVVSPPLLGSLSGGLSTTTDTKEWYAEMVKKPSWTPPPAVFPIAWTVIYIAIGFASFLVYLAPKDGSGSSVINPPPRKSIAIILYVFHLLVNLVWTPLFFGFRLPVAAFWDILLLDMLIIVTTVMFLPYNILSAVIMALYLAWCFFAIILNGQIVVLNHLKFTDLSATI